MIEGNRRYYEILKKYWGYDSFRPTQLEVINSVCAGVDTLALMPTGAGKSLLYQVPAIAMEGVCLVITPLVALMKDQVDRLRKLGISASALHSGLTMRQMDIILDNAAWGDLKFLYVAPERTAGVTFRERLRNMHVSLIAVDEAHCISQWGYDFRPSYLRIAELREMLPDTPVLALTASATPVVAEDIKRNLKMTEGRIIKSSFARPNLSFVVRQTDDKQDNMLRIINNIDGCGIVYVRTRSQTEKIAEYLSEDGMAADHYHGGMNHAERTAGQERWIAGDSRIMVCTNAFGMGIDKPNVRFVIHYDMPDSPEAYYQEAGRAGRDGRRSYAVLLAASDDCQRAVKRFETEYPSLETIKKCYEALFNYLQIGVGDGKYASVSFDINDFARWSHIYTATAFNSIKILQQNGYMTLTGETDNPPRIMFVVGRDELYKIRIDREELDHIIRTILRLYAAIFNDRLVPIDENEIAHASGYTPDKVRELLKKLWQSRIIRYIPGNRSPVLILNEERLPVKDVYISPESYRIRKEMTIGRLEAIFEYAENSKSCRSAVLQRHFGEENPDDCGFCDVCLARKNKSSVKKSGASTTCNDALADSIIKLLHKEPLDIKKITATFRSDPEKVIFEIDRLLKNNTICICEDGKVRIK